MVWRSQHFQAHKFIPVLLLTFLMAVLSPGLSPIYAADCQEIASAQEVGAQTASLQNNESNEFQFI